MAISPVERDIWNREGDLLVRQKTYVMKLVAAIWSANCLRILHRSEGPSMTRIMYYTKCESVLFVSQDRLALPW